MTGDVAGVPVTDSARWRVQSWSPEDFDVTEWACRPHAWDYSLEGPLSALRIWADIDQATQKVIAYHGHLNMQEQESTIWMDGRPHPPASALHTWSGFSTGEWDGDTLVVTTTHVKEAYLRRSGLVDTRREGLWIHYRLGKLADPVMAAIVDAVRHALTHVDTVHRDGERLKRRPYCGVFPPGPFADIDDRYVDGVAASNWCHRATSWGACAGAAPRSPIVS